MTDALTERVARAIDPVAWRWIDKVRADNPTHIALAGTLDHQLGQAERAILAARARTCPFSNKGFEIKPETPCPVCGDLGTFDNSGQPSRCIG